MDTKESTYKRQRYELISRILKIEKTLQCRMSKNLRKTYKKRMVDCQKQIKELDDAYAKSSIPVE